MNNDLSLYMVDNLTEKEDNKDTDCSSGYTPVSLAQEVCRHILSVCSQEPKSVAKSGNIIEMYTRKAMKDIQSNTDSALLPEGLIECVHELDEKDIDDMLSLTETISDSMSQFTPLYSMKIVSTNSPIVVSVGEKDIVYKVPILTETTSGVTGIIPYYGSDDSKIPEVVKNYRTPVGSIGINSIILWDVYNMRTRKP